MNASAGRTFLIRAAITFAVIAFALSYFRVADYCWHAGQHWLGYVDAALPDLGVVVCVVGLRLGLAGYRRWAAIIGFASSFVFVCRGNLGQVLPTTTLDRVVVALWPAWAALVAFLLVELEPATRVRVATRQRTPSEGRAPSSPAPQQPAPADDSEGDREGDDGPDTRAQFAALRGALRRDAVLAYLDEHPGMTQAQASDATGVPLKSIEGYVRDRKRQREEVPA